LGSRKYPDAKLETNKRGLELALFYLFLSLLFHQNVRKSVWFLEYVRNSFSNFNEQQK